VAHSDFHRHVAAVRRFNRFYTRRIGVLQEHLLQSPYSLTEARLIYELAHHEQTTATALGTELGIDAGYLSRLLAGLRKRGLIEKKASESDARQSLIKLSARGHEAFAQLDAGSQKEVGTMLQDLPAETHARLVEAMDAIEGLLGTRPERKAPYLLRPHRAGDMGWVVRSHAEAYTSEYGWNEQFEALVAEIVAKFIREFDSKRERCWIAEKDGENVGSVFLVEKSRTVAQLRLLLVDPKARGLGIGARLVDECARFARQAGYRKIWLWTHSILHAARHIYEKAGYRLVSEAKHRSFGPEVLGQNWELDL
jgi:DNA-binding MarR family transcriptional regulator/ribosomal protein S18 acetylase RimI-like enzyme